MLLRNTQRYLEEFPDLNAPKEPERAWDYPACANCGHPPKEHGRAAMKCEAFVTIKVVASANLKVVAGGGLQDSPCPCEVYEEPGVRG